MSPEARARPGVRLAQSLGIAFLVGLVIVSLAPAFKGFVASRGPIHETAHILAFCVAFLLNATVSRSSRGLAIRALALMVFGAILELAEKSIYGNQLEYRDILSDAVGIGIGVLIRRIIQ
jgi:hypothetical protein